MCALKWIDTRDLKMGPVRHSALTAEQMARIEALHKRLESLDGLSLENRIDCFKRDLHVEDELVVSEKIADVCERAFSDMPELNREQRREIYGLVILRSGASEADVLRHYTPRRIAPQQAKRVLSLF